MLYLYDNIPAMLKQQLAGLVIGVDCSFWRVPGCLSTREETIMKKAIVLGIILIMICHMILSRQHRGYRGY